VALAGLRRWNGRIGGNRWVRPVFRDSALSVGNGVTRDAHGDNY
jgi:hypothetical protein